jgi:hypothetical protein
MGGIVSMIYVPLEDTAHTYVEGCRRGGTP